MSDIIDIEHRRAEARVHREALHDAGRRLRDIHLELFDLAVQVAMTGPLRDWDASQPVGAFTNLEEVLAGVIDGHVVALLQLRECVSTTIERLREVS